MTTRFQPMGAIPDCEGGAPMPFILSDEWRVELIYYVSSLSAENHDITPSNVLAPDGDIVASVYFETLIYKFGYPNEEALHGHPLFTDKLQLYGASEVIGSDWKSQLSKQNQVHPHHSDEIFSNSRHIIFPFHDSTFECLALKYRVKTHKAWIHQVIAKSLSTFSDYFAELN